MYLNTHLYLHKYVVRMCDNSYYACHLLLLQEYNFTSELIIIIIICVYNMLLYARFILTYTFYFKCKNLVFAQTVVVLTYILYYFAFNFLRAFIAHVLNITLMCLSFK